MRGSAKAAAVGSWIKLANGNSRSGQACVTTSEVYTSDVGPEDEEPLAITAKLSPFAYNTIMVERRFDQEVIHDGVIGGKD